MSSRPSARRRSAQMMMMQHYYGWMFTWPAIQAWWGQVAAWQKAAYEGYAKWLAALPKTPVSPVAPFFPFAPPAAGAAKAGDNAAGDKAGDKTPSAVAMVEKAHHVS